MEITLLNVVGTIIAYLMGSVPSAVWIGKTFYNTDVREHGSKNAGATNTFRVLGKKAGVIVLIIDVLKGWGAVQLAPTFATNELHVNSLVNLQIVLGLAAVLGHIFPLYAGFKGGKGVATLLGVVLAIHFNAAIYASAFFVIVLLITGYVSLSSMIAAFSFPVYVIAIQNSQTESLIYFSMFITILILVTHQKNIERLLRKKENKARLIKRTSDL